MRIKFSIAAELSSPWSNTMAGATPGQTTANSTEVYAGCKGKENDAHAGRSEVGCGRTTAPLHALNDYKFNHE